MKKKTHRKRKVSTRRHTRKKRSAGKVVKRATARVKRAGTRARKSVRREITAIGKLIRSLERRIHTLTVEELRHLRALRARMHGFPGIADAGDDAIPDAGRGGSGFFRD